jgi:hypothetical protein
MLMIKNISRVVIDVVVRDSRGPRLRCTASDNQCSYRIMSWNTSPSL